MIYHTKLKELRINSGLSQQELANKVHMRQQTISDIEVGNFNPSLETSIKLAIFFNVTLDEFLDFKKIYDEYSNRMAKIFYNE